MKDDPGNLQNLHDVVSPPDISWWPLAPGWYFVLLIASFVLMGLAWKTGKRWRENAYRRAALKALEKASGDVEVAGILRRTALAIAPRADVAGRTGDDWADWIGSLLPNAMPEDVRGHLAADLYRPQSGGPASDSLRAYASEWIRNHSVERIPPTVGSSPDQTSSC